MRDYTNELVQLNNEIGHFAQALPELNNKVAELEFEAGLDGFWDNLDYAQKQTKELMATKLKATRITTMLNRVAECGLLMDWRIVGEATDAEVDEAFAELTDAVARYKQDLYLGGKYDGENAILTFHAGSGGTESESYVEMLMRMILRWGEANNYQCKITDREMGSIDGTKSATIIINGENAYGYLKNLHGVWRLIRNSPYDKNNCRHTSFAAIDVVPQFSNLDTIVIRPEDIEWDTMRTSTAAGGQATNKNETAVRVHHIPTGIAIRYDVERSQYQNKACALELLKNKLMLLEIEKRNTELNDIRGEALANGWGSQIATITLTPYQLVKDERTGWTWSNTTAFLGGSLDNFIRQSLENNNGTT